MLNSIDHIVYAVPDFNQAINDLEEKLGIRPEPGGRHLLRGTKNALVNLGNRCYLEILARDPENDKFMGQRWMGIDLISQPSITRWAINSSSIEKDNTLLQKYQADLGQISEGERKTTEGETLKWKMTLPLPAPEIDIIPFLIDWSFSDFHPTQNLKEGCILKDIFLFHPDPDSVQRVFDQMGMDISVQKDIQTAIKIKIESINGTILL